MCKIVAVVCEYNPIHTGHVYQIGKIREMHGEDAVVICVMSGHFVQRGEVAMFDKFARAESAVKCGADLVLELPYPYCASSAEFFARAGVEISASVGAEFLVFGSESGDTDRLKLAAEIFSSDEAKRYISEHKNEGILRSRQRIYTELTGDDSGDVFSSNDILGVEYIRAMNALGVSVKPHAIRREGADYNDVSNETDYMSATGLRKSILAADFETAKRYIPKPALDVFAREIAAKSAPAEMKNLEKVILAFLRIAEAKSLARIAEISGGLEYRIIDAAKKATNIETFFSLLETKKYTNGRLRRAVLYCLTGVTEAMLKQPPSYTQVLSFSEKGRAYLGRIRKSARIAVMTNPSGHGSRHTEKSMEQFGLSMKADELYALSLPKSRPAADYLRMSPYGG